MTRCDCTTRNARKAAILAERMDELEVRIDELRESEDLNRLRPALDAWRSWSCWGFARDRSWGGRSIS